MSIALRVATAYRQASDEAALEAAADALVDAFFDALFDEQVFAADSVEAVLRSQGLRADNVNALAEGKQAGLGQAIRALGGMVLHGVWHALMQPFVAIKKLIFSAQFRAEVKRAFKRALRHEVRSTRHMLRVFGRLARGENVNPHERKAAFHQMLDILTKVMFVYLAGPHVAALFSHGIWKALMALLSPIDEILVVLLDRPMRAVMVKLLSADIGILPSGFYTHF